MGLGTSTQEGNFIDVAETGQRTLLCMAVDAGKSRVRSANCSEIIDRDAAGNHQDSYQRRW
jgi:hypothetical protein